MYQRYKAKINNEVLIGLPPKTPRCRTKTNLTITPSKNTKGNGDALDLDNEDASSEGNETVLSENESVTELKEGLLRGDFKQVYPVNSKIVRIFTSSTFTDTKHERNALMERVYPKLKTFCRGYGYEFQVVDMRWGVRDESSNDHTTTELCLREIEACQRLSIGPNFVTFLSHKYGYCPFPRIIEAKEFEAILSANKDGEKVELLQQWFKKDENAVPSSYILQPISTYIPEYLEANDKAKSKAARNKWWEIYEKLSNALKEGAVKALKEEEVHKYKMSVTEKELTEGILERSNVESSTFWFYRHIVDIDEQPDSYLLSRYKDLKNPQEERSEAQDLLNDLKETKLKKKLPPKSISNFKVQWAENGINPDNEEKHKQYIDDLCSNFEVTLKNMIERGMSEQTPNILKEPLFDELVQHTAFCQKKYENFCGREEVLEKIEEYVVTRDKQPFVVYGESGIGKTSIMAATTIKCQEWLDYESVVVARFIGTTPESSTIRTVLQSILTQIYSAYDLIPQTADEDNFDISTASLSALCWLFKSTLTTQVKRETRKKPLVVIIDSLDQLSPDGNPQDLSWLPEKLCRKVKLIVSTLPDTDKSEYGYMTALKTRFGKYEEENFLQLTRIKDSDVHAILERWLTLRKRKLTQSQMKVLINTFDFCPIPLYLNLCFEESCLWTSYQGIEEATLEKSVHDAISKLFGYIERKHGHLLVSHTLAYITASRNGLSEPELEDILACDDVVLNDVYQYWTPPVRRLPPLLFVRLRADLQQYMVERGSEGIKVIYWYHRQFIDTARERYLLSIPSESLLKVHQIIAEFFMGTWSDKAKPFINKQGQEDLNERLVASQPLKYQNSYNVRKFMEMPIHLIKAKMFKELEMNVLYNLEWLSTKMKATSYYDVIADYEKTIELVPENDIDIESLKYLLSVLRLSQNALQYDPYQLPGQFLGRSKQAMEKFKGVCFNPPYPAILPSELCLESPGSDLRYQLSASDTDVNDVDVTKDGNLAVTCSNDQTIKIWDVEKGTLVRSITDACEEDSELRNVRLCCSDSQIIVSSIVNDGEFRMQSFNIVTGVENKIRRPPRFSMFYVYGEEKTRAVFYIDKTISVMDLQKWRFIIEPVQDPDCKGKIQEEDAELYHSISASQNIIALAYENKRWFWIYNIEQKSFLPKVHVYQEKKKDSNEDEDDQSIGSVVVSNDASWVLVTNYMTNDLDFFGTSTGSHLRTLKGDSSLFLERLKLMDNSKWLVCTSSTSVCLWNIEDNEQKIMFKHPLSIDSFSVSEDMTRFVTVSGPVLRVWERSEDTTASAKADKDQGTKYVYLGIFPFTNSARYIVIELKISDQIYWDIFDVFQKKTSKRIKIDSTIRNMYFISNEQAVIIIKSQIAVVDLKNNEVVKVLQGSIPYYGPVHLLHDGKEILAFTKSRRQLKILSVDSGKVTHVLHTGSERKLDCSDLIVNKTSTVAVTAEDIGSSKSNDIIVFSLTEKRLLHRLSLNGGIDDYMAVNECVITYDGKYMAHSHESVVTDPDYQKVTKVLVWDLEKGSLLHEVYDKEAVEKCQKQQEQHINDEIPTPDQVCAMLFNGQKPLYIQGCGDGHIRTINIIKGELEHSVNPAFGTKDHYSDVTSIPTLPVMVKDPPNYLVAVHSSDHSVWVYDTTEWKPVASFKTDMEMNNITQLVDGSMMVGFIEQLNKPLILQLYDSHSGLPNEKLTDKYPILYADEGKEYEIGLLQKLNDPNHDDPDDLDTDEVVETDDDEEGDQDDDDVVDDSLLDDEDESYEESDDDMGFYHFDLDDD